MIIITIVLVKNFVGYGISLIIADLERLARDLDLLLLILDIRDKCISSNAEVMAISGVNLLK